MAERAGVRPLRKGHDPSANGSDPIPVPADPAGGWRIERALTLLKRRQLTSKAGQVFRGEAPSPSSNADSTGSVWAAAAISANLAVQSLLRRLSSDTLPPLMRQAIR